MRMIIIGLVLASLFWGTVFYVTYKIGYNTGKIDGLKRCKVR